MRIDVYNNVVSKIVKSDYLDNYNLSKIDKSVFISEPFIIKDKNLVLVSSDIISSYGKIIGKDIAIFKFNKIKELEKITDKIAIVNQDRIIYSNRDNLTTINTLNSYPLNGKGKLIVVPITQHMQFGGLVFQKFGDLFADGLAASA